VIDVVIAIAGFFAIVVGVVVLGRISVSYPIAGSAIATGFGALALVLIAYRLIDPPGGGGVDREIGAWLGLIAAAGIVWCGWLGMQEPRAVGTASAA
jgi:hypothetical protein